MKRKFSKILGIGLSLALMVSLLLTAVPVLADVSQPTVDVDPDEISADGVYTISFRINTELLDTLAGSKETTPTDADTITIRFPEDTDISAAVVANDGVSFTSGIGWGSGASVTVTVDLDPDDPIVEITLNDLGGDGTNGDGIGAMAYVQVVISNVTNPTDAGTYTLEVQTSEEDDYVVSESYDIEIPVVGGFVYVYNPSMILLATFGGEGALNGSNLDTYLDGTDYTIVVGPGSYNLDSSGIEIYGEGLTFKSSDGAADTIINADDATGRAISIHGDDITVDGFTIDDSPNDGIWIFYGTTGVTVINNIITDAVDSGIVLMYAPGTPASVVAEATVSDNVIEDSGAGIGLSGAALDNTISNNTITGSANQSLDIHGGTTLNPTEGNTITGNTITANETMGIRIKVTQDSDGGDVFKDNVIEGNTISENEGHGIWLFVDSPATEAAADITGFEILNNVITDNEGDGILLEAWAVDIDTSGGTTVWAVSNVIKFNTITGNDTSTGDYDIQNDSAVDVDATFNWWGTTVADDIGDMVSGDDVIYEPFLTGIAEAATEGGNAAANASSLDAKDEAGVKVSGVIEDVGTLVLVTPDVTLKRKADIISAVKFAANPEDALDDAIAFYDVYVVLDADFNTTDVTAKLKFYDSAITTGSTAYFWTGDFWALASDQEARGGIIYVTITDDTLPAIDELEETIFGVVAGEAVTALVAPALLAPEAGAGDVSLTPIFAWGAVADATGYDFELADNADFSVPLVSKTGYNRLLVTAYAYLDELPYSTAYYWRVKAVSATDESVWASSVFIIMAEPAIVLEPADVILEPADVILEPADIIIEQPDIVVTLPAATPITPAWIYVIIAVATVLVIGLIVLIVRTRRVA